MSNVINIEDRLNGDDPCANCGVTEFSGLTLSLRHAKLETDVENVLFCSECLLGAVSKLIKSMDEFIKENSDALPN